MAERRRVLLGVGGGIAAYKAPDLVRRLRDQGFEVRCAVTRAATSFVTPLSLEVVAGHPVYQEEYLQPGVGGEEVHIAAAAWADALVVAPATAHLMARLALGLADDFLTTVALAFTGPLVVAPAMHAHMWEHAATQQHVGTLLARGARLVGPVVGPLASGEVAIGRMAEPLDVAAAVSSVLAPAGPLAGVAVLVSAGPTWEAVDPVRFLGNRSSGRMGFALAAEAQRRGARVTLVAGPVALPTPPGVERVDVESAREMRAALLARVGEAQLVLMAAAVADYRPRQAATQKLGKDQGIPQLELEENPDILAEIGALPGDRLIVGFAAETHDLERRAPAKLKRKGAHFLVANDVSRSDIGFGSEHNEVTVFRRDGEPIRLPRQSKAAVAGKLLDLFGAALAGSNGRTAEQEARA